MSKQVIQFLLVPDGSAARYIRRAIAESGAHAGVQVGTWLELVELAGRAYLIPDRAAGWEEVFSKSLSESEDAFWSESYAVAPDETAEAIASAYIDLLSALGKSTVETGSALTPASERIQRHFTDLAGLSTALDGALPSDLNLITELLAAESTNATSRIRVLSVHDVPPMPKVQRTLVSKLNADAGVDADPLLAAILEAALNPEPPNKETSALQTLQSKLYASADNDAVVDNSVQWVGARDFLEEAEVAAGMAQSLLTAGSELHASDIGILIPDKFEYALALSDAFDLAGLPLSGLPAERWQRDLGREAVLHFLYCRQKPTPAMALGACLASPLMPWSREDGADFAQRVMSGDYRLKSPRDADPATRAMLGLFREGDEDAESLKTALLAFAELLLGSDDQAHYVAIAKTAAIDLVGDIGTKKEIDWAQLRRRVTPKRLPSGEAPNFNLEGVTVWRETHEPWRAVRHLLVLGFTKGHYPTVPGPSPVFARHELDLLNEMLGTAVPTPATELANRRNRFRRQLRRVGETVTFLVPRRDALGKSAPPSESLVFMSNLLGQGAGADALILDLDDASQRASVRHLGTAPRRQAEAPRPVESENLELDIDLLSLRKDDDGQIKPESPSGLETLMVSPLAWLLRRLGAEPLGWAPESPNPLLLGSLAHKVFEGLFAPDVPLPNQTTLPSRVETLLDGAIREMAPFLRAAQWQVERRNLVSSLIKAAQGWLDVIRRLDAEILAGEETLVGEFHHRPIQGQVDLILGLNDGSLLVVDYKRSSSASRRSQMQAGFDSQASLYRTMLSTGGPKDTEKTTLRKRLSESGDIGVVYYMLNDQTALSDTSFPTSGSIPGWDVPGADISSNAISLITTRLDEVAKGLIRLNGVADRVFFEKTAGIKPYALDNSPLVGLFTGVDLVETLE